LTDALERTRHTRTLVEDLISHPEQLGPDFTPIRRIDDLDTVLTRAPLLGWKATGRGRPGTAVADTLALLDEARRLGLVERLDWSFRCHTFDLATQASLQGELHLTPEPETFGAPCPPRLAVSFLRGRRALAVCAELHEDSFVDERRLRVAVDQMREWGWQFVYADLGGTPAERSALELMEWIRPAYVQVNFASPHRSAALVQGASRIGATLMGIGVDSAPALAQARDLGIRWARGALLGQSVASL
jgi:hypothetical protein